MFYASHFPLSLAAQSLSPMEGEWLVTGLAVVGFVVAILVGIKKLSEKRSTSIAISNTPLETRGVTEYVPMTRFEQFEAYVHKQNHDMRDQLQHLELSAEERRTEAAEHQTKVLEVIGALSDKLDGKRSHSVGNLHGELKGAQLELSNVRGELTSLIRTVDQQGQKIDRLAERIPPTKPAR